MNEIWCAGLSIVAFVWLSVWLWPVFRRVKAGELHPNDRAQISYRSWHR